MGRLNVTDIEWVFNPDGTRPGRSWNPFSGCLNHKNGLCLTGLFPCYAHRLANGRVRNLYLNNKDWDTRKPDGIELTNDHYPNLDPFYPRRWQKRLEEPCSQKAPVGIFACDMSDWCGLGMPREWSQTIIDTAIKCPQHRFYLLTKQCQNLQNFSPFPDNCWVGGTVTKHDQWSKVIWYLGDIVAPVKFISMEPMLSRFPAPYLGGMKILDWLIIGACTGTRKAMLELKDKYPDLTLMEYGNKWTAQPPIDWLAEVVKSAIQNGVRVFLKDNLDPLIIQESQVKHRGLFVIDRKVRREVPDYPKTQKRDNFAAVRSFERQFFPYGQRIVQDTPGGITYGVDH